jgi:hypothetical protein
MLAGLLVAAGLAGCATDQSAQQTENRLQAAGFRAVQATTPAQQQMLRLLPAAKVSAVQRDGQVLFVYPIPARNLLDLGSNEHYLTYQSLAQGPDEQALVAQEMQAIERFTPSPAWSAPPANWDVNWDLE